MEFISCETILCLGHKKKILSLTEYLKKSKRKRQTLTKWRLMHPREIDFVDP